MNSLIFHGRRLVKLLKWRNFSVSVNLLLNGSAFSSSFFSASSSSSAYLSPRDGRKGKIFTVSYLVDSLGLSTKLAESISRKVSFEDKVNPDSVLNLLSSYGFTGSQTSNIIRNYPGLLILDAEKSLAPKLKFLQSRGASSSELTQTVSKLPKILGMKGDKTISVYYDLVKYIIEADKSSKFKKLCPSLPQGNRQENIIRNVLLLREVGVPQRLLFSLLISSQKVCYGKEKFEESLKKIVEMGFDPTSAKFVEALTIVQGLSVKTIEEKVNVYKKLGFTVGDVWDMFKKWPFFRNYSEKKISQTFETLKKCGLLEYEVLSVMKKFPVCISVSEQKILNCMETFLGLGFSRAEFTTMVKLFPACIGYSAESVKKKTEFLVEKMNWPLKVIISQPQVLGCSMEKRIVPRCNVIKALMSKGLLGDTGSELPPIGSVLKSTDEEFLKMFVRKHDDKELVAKLMTRSLWPS